MLSVTERPGNRRPHYPIDHFLRSLAAVHGPSAVGVILSGTGSDGTLGLSEIKAAGGVTFAQDERTAQHGGMPQSAIASGAVDLVLPPEEIGHRLGELRAHPYLEPPDAVRADRDEGGFLQIIAALKNTTGVDFSHYRDTTIRRRAARRMLLRGFRAAADYARFVERDPGEADALYRDVLINVTSFFREPEMFEELKRVVFPEIVREPQNGQPIRVWVPGCSTGQEAYSLAIALLEVSGRGGTQAGGPDLRDGSRRSGFARARAQRRLSGEHRVGSESRAASPVLHEGRSEATGFQKSVRDLCVFARQNITVDPPFSRVDLVSCRNVLIYMSATLQERLVPMFHFALNRGGFLVLGVAETVGSSTDLFEQVSRAHKIYRRKDSSHRTQLTFMSDQWLPGRPLRPEAFAQQPDFIREADRLTLSRYAPPAVLVNQNFEVQQYRGPSSPFLEAPPGQPTASILRLAREGLFVESARGPERGQSGSVSVVNAREPGTSRTEVATSNSTCGSFP